jgi:type I restriction enzyme S subunit
MILSRNWPMVPLSEALTYIGNGLTANQSKSGGGIPVSRIETIADDCIDESRVGFVSDIPDDVIAKYLLVPGDILFSHINSEPQIGRAVVYEGRPKKLLHGMNLLRLRANEGMVNPSFLAYTLKYYREQGVFVGLATRAVGQSSINQGRLKTLEVPLPPLEEQRAIISVLGSLQRAKKARQLELTLECERKAALTEYLFTQGTRAEPTKQTEVGEIPESWQVAKLGDCCEFLQYGTSRQCNAITGGAPVLGIPNVVHRRVTGGRLRFLRATDEERKKLELRSGDLIFVRTNANRETTGRCAVFRDEIPHALFASYLIRARLNTQSLLPDFAREYTDTQRGKAYLSGRASHAADGKFNINTQTIRNVVVPQPSIDDQQEIATILRTSDKKINALEKEVQLIEELFIATLEELMTGRLSSVPLIKEH